MNPIKKISLYALLLLFLSACATSNFRYPEYRETVKSHNDVSIVLDVNVLRAIDGPNLGFNEAFNLEKLEEVENQLIELFTERGFKPSIVSRTHDLTFDPKRFFLNKKDREIFYSLDWQSTEVPFEQGVSDESASDTQFFKSLIEVARKINYGKNKTTSVVETSLEEKKKEADEPFFSLAELAKDAEALDNIETDHLVFISVEGMHVRTGEIFVNSIVPALVSGVVTGGNLILTPSGTVNIAEMAVFNIKNNSVLWYSRNQTTQTFNLERLVSGLFRAYPYSDGLTPRRKKQQRIRKRS